MQTRTPLILLSALALACQPLLAQDQLVKQALSKIASVETALPALVAGDVKAANQLLADLKWAQKRLNAAYKKDTTFWLDASKRLTAADEAIRKLAAATPKPAGQPAPTGQPAPAGQPAPTGQPGSTVVVGEQFEKLQQLNKEVKNGFANLNLLNKTFMGDAFRVGSTKQEIQKLQARLAAFPAGDQNVAIVAANLKQFADQFATWQAEYQADLSASEALGKQLDEISAKYDSKAVPTAIFWPYEQDMLRTWAERSHKLLVGLEQDVAVVEAASNNAILGKRAKSMLHWLARSIPNRLNEQIDQVQQVCNNAVRDSLATAKSLREIKPDDEHAIINRVLIEGAPERSMASLQKGMDAVAMAATLDIALEVKDAPDRNAQHKEIEDTIVVLRSLAKSALAQVRLPKPVKLDEQGMAELTKIATETLALKKYGTNKILKLVVTSKLSRKEKTEGDIRGTVTGATITTYHYVWDEYHVVTAEQVGDDVWIFYNTLKFYHSSDSVTPQDQWILSKRFQSTQILAENLEK